MTSIVASTREGNRPVLVADSKGAATTSTSRSKN